MFKTDFFSRIENQAILFHAILTEREARKAMSNRNLSPEQIREVSNIILDCQEVLVDTHDYPDAGEA